MTPHSHSLPQGARGLEKVEMTTLRLFSKITDGEITAGRDYDDLDIVA